MAAWVTEAGVASWACSVEAQACSTPGVAPITVLYTRGCSDHRLPDLFLVPRPRRAIPLAQRGGLQASMNCAACAHTATSDGIGNDPPSWFLLSQCQTFLESGLDLASFGLNLASRVVPKPIESSSPALFLHRIPTPASAYPSASPHSAVFAQWCLLSLSLSLSLSVCVCVFLSLCVCVSLYACLSLELSLSLSGCVCLSVCVCGWVGVGMCVRACLRACVRASHVHEQ